MTSLEVTRETIREQPDGSAVYEWTFRSGEHGAAFRVDLQRRESDGRWCTFVLEPDHIKDWSKLVRKPGGYSSGTVKRPAFESREDALSHAESEMRGLLSRAPDFSCP
jgi:hypothetical protein